MADRTAIEWADATWNPLRGCTRVSEGCRNCYAETMAARFSNPGGPYHGIADRTRPGSKWTNVVRRVPQVMDQPLRWRRSRRIFTGSMSDLFHESVPFEWIDPIFGVMGLTPQHIYQVLTKRPARMLEWVTQARVRPAAVECVSSAYYDYPSLAGRWPFDERRAIEVAYAGWPLPHVWLGTSVEHQDAADTRIPILLRTPAAKRFLSCEPLLGPLNLTPWLSDDGIGWVIAGGESGCNARPMHPDWARSLRDQCERAGVPFLFKQWGEFHPEDQPNDVPGEDWNNDAAYPDGTRALRVGKHRAGNRLDGRLHLEFPP